MNMGFDHRAWPSGREDAAPASFDWQGLRARFLAAQACRSELARPQGEVESGSFAPAVAEALAHFDDGTRGINPNDLADRKADRPDGEATPGHPGPTFEGNDD